MGRYSACHMFNKLKVTRLGQIWYARDGHNSLMEPLYGKHMWRQWRRSWSTCPGVKVLQCVTHICCSWLDERPHCKMDDLVEFPPLPNRTHNKILCKERGNYADSTYRPSSQLIQKAPLATQIPVLWTGSITHNLTFAVELYEG
jgi:hypothetical protein